jgi:hypothetical protein
MNVQETLTQIDHIMTEVDLVLYEWTEAVDMMSFIGVDTTFAMWTDEIPPRIVTSRNISLLPLQGIHDVRVMHLTANGWTKVGTARINEDGNFVARIDLEIPGLTDMKTNFSIDEVGKFRPLPSQQAFEPKLPLAHFSIDNDGKLKQNRPLNPPFESFENHPFFKEN